MTTVSLLIATTVAAAKGHWITRPTLRLTQVATERKQGQPRLRRDKPRWLASSRGGKRSSIEGCILAPLWVTNLKCQGCILLKLLRVVKLSRGSRDRESIVGLQLQVDRLTPTISLCSAVADGTRYLSMICTTKITMMSLIMEMSMTMKIQTVFLLMSLNLTSVNTSLDLHKLPISL